MNETAIQQMLKAAQTYIKYLETKEEELLVKTHELACKVDDLTDANAMLVKSNEDLARKLQYFRACNNNQANMILKLQKEYNAY